MAKIKLEHSRERVFLFFSFRGKNILHSRDIQYDSTIDSYPNHHSPDFDQFRWSSLCRGFKDVFCNGWRNVLG